MSFHPVNAGFSRSLLGNSNTIYNADQDTLIDRDIHGVRENNSKNRGLSTLIIVILSAMIFVTIIAIFDVFKNAINNYYAARALKNPKAGNSQQDINSTLIANTEGLTASVIFAILCIVLTLIAIYFLYSYI